LTKYSAHNSWTNRRIAYSRLGSKAERLAASIFRPDLPHSRHRWCVPALPILCRPASGWPPGFLLHGPGEYVSFLGWRSAEEAGGIPNDETPRVRYRGAAACVAARRARSAGGDRVPQGASPGPFAYFVAAFRHGLPEMD